jgi:hypothetical protein
MKYLNKMKAIIIAAVLLPAVMQAQSRVAEQPANLRVEQGTSIVANGDVKIVLNDANFVNNGSFTAGASTLLFTGSAAKQTMLIGGSSRTAFYNLSINRPFEQLQLDNDISVSGALNFTAGNLELNNRRLDLGSTGFIVGENINARIMGAKGGVVVATAMLNAPARVNPGNIGVELTSSANLGATTITRGHVQQVNARGQSGINRYYDIKAANSNAPVSVRFFYLQPEVGGLNESELVLWSGDAFKGWSAAGKEYGDVSMDWVSKNNLGQVNKFTLGLSEKNVFAARDVKGVQAFPNPARDRFTITVYSDVERGGIMSLQDEKGHVLERKQLQYIKGMNTAQWNIAKYAAGTYYVVFEGTGLQNVKVVKQ